MKQAWFLTLNDALESEGLFDLWPLGVNVNYGQTVSLASGGRWITVYRDNEGRYERPAHYATKMADTHSREGAGNMTDEQKLISDLAECHADLAAWARDKIRDGSTVAEIKAMMREAARLVGRD